MAEWRQGKNMLTCSNLGMTIHFEMNEDFDLEKVHKDSLKLCEWLMFGPWDKEILRDYTWTRKRSGDNIGLAYSGGVDSTAALTLLDFHEGLYLFYMQRHGIEKTLMNQANPLESIRLVEEIRGQEVVKIKTDFEKVRHFLGNKINGFSTDLCVLIGSILMADQYKIGYLACGQMLESTWLQHGYEYRDFKESGYWKRHTDVFESAGFKLYFPVHACSEVLTSKIAESGRYYGVGNPCLRSSLGGRACMNCYKCFRKQMIGGKQLPVNPDALRQITNDKIKQGASLVYAYNKFGFYEHNLEKYKGVDYSFLEDYYAPALELVPEEWRPQLEAELSKYASPMEFDLSKFEWKQND